MLYAISFLMCFCSPIGMYFFSKRTIKNTFLSCAFWLVSDIFFLIYNIVIEEYPLALFFFLNNLMTIRILRKALNERKNTNIN